MLKRLKQRLKDLLLPFENPNHPKYFDKAAAEEAKRQAEKEEAEVEAGFRAVLGDLFGDRVYGPGDNFD